MEEDIDPFDHFDLDSGSEKDFLIENYKKHAPWREMMNLRRALKSTKSSDCMTSYSHWDTTMTPKEFEETKVLAQICERDYGSEDWEEFKFMESATEEEIEARTYQLLTSEKDEKGNVPLANLKLPPPRISLEKRAEDFAQAHAFNANMDDAPTTVQSPAFAFQIYKYARSAGFGHHMAKALVKIAKAARQQRRGTAAALMLEDSDDELMPEVETEDIISTVDATTHPLGKEMLSKKRKRNLDGDSRGKAVYDLNSQSEPGSAVIQETSPKRKKRRKDHDDKSRRNTPVMQVSLAGSNGGVTMIEDHRSVVKFQDLNSQIGLSKRNIEKERGKMAARDLEISNHAVGGNFIESLSTQLEVASQNVRPKNAEKFAEGNMEPQTTIFEGTGFEDQRKKKKKRGKNRETGNVLQEEHERTQPKGDRDETVLELKQRLLVRGTVDLNNTIKPLSEVMGRNEKLSDGHHVRRDRGRGRKPGREDPFNHDQHQPLEKARLIPALVGKGDIYVESDATSYSATICGDAVLDLSQMPPSGTWNGKSIHQAAQASPSVKPSYQQLTIMADDEEIESTAPEFSPKYLENDNEDVFNTSTVSAAEQKARTFRQTAKFSSIPTVPTPMNTPQSKRHEEYAGSENDFTTPTSAPRTTRYVNKKPPTKSPFFSPSQSTSKSKLKRSPGGIVSCIPFPPLSASRFGLLQEKLAYDPLRLLIGVTFLIRTHGRDSIPVFFELIEKYPTASELASASREDIINITRHLGLQAMRADMYIRFAKCFIEDPPVKGKRYRVENYPDKGAHAGIKKGEVLDNDDPRIGAWEIGHITKGRYAIDSWRIFCRDVLRGVAQGLNGEEADDGFQPEWMRVLPQDKELRAYLRWMWLKEGFEWDPLTGEKEIASPELLEAAELGRVEWDDWGGMRVVDEAGEQA